MAVEYRPFQLEDLPAQRKLFEMSFPESKGTAAGSDAYHTWKFRDFPASPPAYEYVGEDDGRLVAYYAALPYPYRLKDRSVRGGMVCDVMTHPSHRGKGLFTAVGRYATKELARSGLAFVTGYPIRPEVIPGHLKVGWRIVQALPVWLNPVGTRSFLPEALRPAASTLDLALHAVRCWIRPARDYRVEVLDRERFLSDIAGGGEYRELLARWAASVPNTLQKNAAFMRWRTGAPGAAYRFALLWRGATLAGMAVIRPAVLKGIKSLAMLDCMIDPAHLGGATALHVALARLARSMGHDAVASMCSREWARRYRFARSGYIRTPAVFSLIIKKLDDSIPDDQLYDASRWHVFWLDSDDL